MNPVTNIAVNASKRVPLVYLDSSDYSVLSEAMRNVRHEHRKTFDYLIDLVDHREIEIRFSSVHIFEIAHLDEASKCFATQRATCVQRLTGGRCFRFWQDLKTIELLNLVNNKPAREETTSDDGYWFPDLGDFAVILKQSLVDGFKAEAYERGLNRRDRRKLESKLIRNGQLTKKAISLLKEQDRGVLLSEIAQQIPLSEEFYREDMMLKHVSGELSSAELGHEMSLLLRDIEKFIGWTFDTRDTEKKLVKWLRELGTRNIEAIEKLRKNIEPISRNPHLKLDTNKLISQTLAESADTIRRREIHGVMKENTTSKRQSGELGLKWSELCDSPLGTIPSMDAFYLGLMEHFRRNIQMNRKLKASDSGDLFHLSYLPYCDVFRADGDASQTAKPLADLYGTRIVSKLKTLRSSIDAALEVGTKHGRSAVL